MRTNFPVFGSDYPVSGFPFHAACWRIMTEVSSPSPVDLRLFYELCLSFPVWDGIMQWGHDYDGSTSLAEDPALLVPGEEGHVIRSRVIGIHYCDPLEIPEMRPLFEDMDRANIDYPPSDGPSSLPRCSTDHGADIFARLPVEILQAIVTQLPTPDVAALRRSSRVCAGLPLHDLFWRSRFQPGGEFDSIFEAASYFSPARASRGRWQEVYHALRALQRQLHCQVCMRNRRRVWHLASSLVDLMSRARGIECKGAVPTVQGLGEDVHWTTACRGLHDLWNGFSYGSRRLLQGSVNVPDDAVGLFVSTIDIFGRRYISGIRIQQADGHSVNLGYIHPRDEALVLFCEQGRLRITGFVLAQDLRGVRGLSVISEAGTQSDWVGDHRDLPLRRLVSASSGTHLVKCFKGGFDVGPSLPAASLVPELTICFGLQALKLVALSVPAAGHPQNDLIPRDEYHWFPDFPEPHLKFLGAENILNRDEKLPVSVARFGGLQGQDLARLVNLTIAIRVGGWIPALLGIEISFSDGRLPVRLGRCDGGPKSEVINFAIDGPGGERINAVDKLYWMRNLFSGLQVSNLPSICSRLDRARCLRCREGPC